jgi:hypothetical protein
MSYREIAATFRDNGDDAADATIAATLRKHTRSGTMPIRRANRPGFYVHEVYVDQLPKRAKRKGPTTTASGIPLENTTEVVEESQRLAHHPLCAIIKDSYPTCTCGAYADEATRNRVREDLTANEILSTDTLNRVHDALINLPPNAALGISRDGIKFPIHLPMMQPKVSMDASWAAAHEFPFTHIRIVRTLSDGRVLFTDDPSGRAWIAKEV